LLGLRHVTSPIYLLTGSQAGSGRAWTLLAEFLPKNLTQRRKVRQGRQEKTLSLRTTPPCNPCLPPR